MLSLCVYVEAFPQSPHNRIEKCESVQYECLYTRQQIKRYLPIGAHNCTKQKLSACTPFLLFDDSPPCCRR
jgi:hypothetical protein